MEKESLTKENIKNDILPLLLGDVAGAFIAYFILLVLGKLVVMFFKNGDVAVQIGFVLFIVLTIALLLSLTYILIIIYKTRRFQFIIKIDILVSKQEGGGHPGTTGWSAYKPYTLNFNTCNKFFIPAQVNYKWSSLHSMDEKGVFNSSNLGDKFLLITLREGKVMMAYNLSLFDFQE